MKTTVLTIACFSTLSLATTAYATEIDFTSIPPNPNGSSSWSTTVDGVTVTVTPGPAGTKLYWDSTDGFGVNGPTGGYEVDEIDSNESLTVSFSDAGGNPVSVVLQSFSVTDLFYEQQNAGNRYYYEQGSYAVDGGGATFAANTVTNPSNVNGTGTVMVDAVTTSLVLTAPGLTNWSSRKGVFLEDNEFSLAGLEFSAPTVDVPELSAAGAGGALFLLAGLGLVLGGGRRRPLVAA